MTNRNIFSLVNAKAKKYQTDYGLEKIENGFTWLVLENTLELNSDDIDDAITDGPNDGGIDAIYINERTVHFFTFEYTSVFENTNKNFSPKELDQYLVTIQGILDHTITKDDINPFIWEKANEIWDLLTEGSLNFKFYVCSNKLTPIETARKKFEARLAPYRFVEFFYIDLEAITNKIIERKFKKVDGEINFIDKQYFDRSDGNIKGIVATITAEDLIKIVTDPSNPNQVNENVLDLNVRRYRPKHRINKRMLETALSDENYQFWYLNNGITIICESCDYVPNTRSPHVKLKNFQIVNGGQTTHTIFLAYQSDKAKVENILLLARICVAQRDNPIAEKISETTNSQIPVTTRDLHSNDLIQTRLEDEFESLGYFYESKPNKFENKPVEIRLNNELLAQLYLAYYFDMPSEAKNEKSLVFGEKYEEVFYEDVINAKRMLLPYRIYLPLKEIKRGILRRKRRKEPVNERDAFISRAIFHIVNTVKFIAEYENLNLDQQSDIDVSTQKAIEYISEVVERERNERGDLYTHDKFFKETATNVLIREHVEEKYRAIKISSDNNIS